MCKSDMANYSLRKTDEREQRFQRLREATGESTTAGAIDVAVQHYLADKRAKGEIVDELPADVLDELSTPWLPIEAEVRVGREP